MWSKLYRANVAPGILGHQLVRVPRAPFIRQLFGFPKQYQQPVSDRFRLLRVLKHHWELTPLLLCVVFDMFLIAGATYHGFKNSVDIQVSGHSWNCLSRSMDLRAPTVHKHLVLHQQYRPWPELQAVLDKMAAKEARPCALRTLKNVPD